MFEIRCGNDIDIKNFELEYNKNRELIDYLIDNINRLDDVLDIVGYDDCYNMILFLNMCEVNYIVSKLMHVLITYCHQKEDEMFLELYGKFQAGEMDDWLTGCNLTDLKKVERCIKEDRNVAEAFPEIVVSITDKEKSFSF